MGARKKTCPKCGRYLWLRDFYRRKKDGAISTYCKECERKAKREEYARNRKKPDGLFKNMRTGQVIEHKGASTRIYWSGYMVEKLKRLFPTTKNADIAVELNVSPRTMIRKARELGLEKSKEWQRAHALRNCQTMRIINKCCGNSGMIKPGEHKNPAGEFKKIIV